MKSSSELRIGNLYIDIDDQLSELSGYELYQMTIKENNENLGINEYKPIVLNEEWLLKFDFKLLNKWNDGDNPEFKVYSNSNNNFKVVRINNEFYWYNYVEDDFYSTYGPKLDFVHQLQNLYFVLNGQELELKM